MPSPREESLKKKYGQYFSPEVVANFMLSLADIVKQSTILEPACGKGVFLKLLGEKGYNNITAYEIDNTLSTEFKSVRYESFVSATIKEKFDLIIGNPPYIRWKNLEQELKDELRSNDLWNEHFNSLCDYLYIFILKSIELLKENGQLIFICPEYWMNTTHSLGLRNSMVKNGYFEQIYHFNETPIFSNASVSVIIFKYIKSKQSKAKISITKYYKNKALTRILLSQLKDDNYSNSEIIKFKVKQFELNKRWLLTREDEIEKMEQFETSCVLKNRASKDLFTNPIDEEYCTIGDVCDIGNGMVSGLDKAFQLNGEKLLEKEKESTIKVIKAKDLEAFYFNKLTRYIFVKNVKDEAVLKDSYPTFYEKLIKQRDKLENRYQYKRKASYWQWVFLRNYNLFNSERPRIFVPCKERISNKGHFRFSFVESGIFPTQDVTAIFLKEKTKESIFYLLSFLNNHRVFNWLKNKGIVKGSIVEFSEKPISSIPFKKIDWNDKNERKLHDEITDLTHLYLKNNDDIVLDKIRSLFDKLLK